MSRRKARPTHAEKKNTFWTKVGVAFAHHSKPGLNIVLTPGLAVSGKLVLLEPRDDCDTPPEPGAMNAQP
ncbi:hypothetical protein OS42_38240 [Dickeya oryzae]